ncbi:MAG: aminotransferase class III-fold pyridoxal phosphate-dependent enzyme [Myxococcales bacterium]|nr:aminotransferase class III-fold pyridoxal phosphate-dependent enzyme [Myxococcales bacterium]MCB9692202.1 aminotransferase class III-fold pyridoxal phosphate-dependent enzyme [Alphaproteobacteria bacterium]
MIDACLAHTLYTWTATGSVDPLPVKHADGVYLYGPEGQKWLDFNSQLMSVNIGHNHPKIKEAIKKQVDELIYTYPGTATEPRAKLAKRLAEIMPGDIDTFFFTLGGAEANENAIKLVRQYSGRFKILSRYRSYHGATNATMMLTGDPRRWPSEPGAPGFVHVMDPWPYTFSWGESEEEITAKNLTYLEEVIQYEGPSTIAAMFIETVTGTNGILPPPKGYLKGLRALLDKYGILLVCDEVMAGFGRTGKLMAFEHGDIVPDLVTMAKGLTSSYIPLGAVGMRSPIAEHFRKNTFWGGLTYNSHALCMATALAAVDALIEDGCIENAARLGPIMRDHMERMKQKHPSVRAYRQIGLFGMMDVQKPGGEPIAPYNGGHPKMNEMGKYFRDNGLFTFVRWGSFMCNPPLCITEEQLAEGFDIIDRALDIPDQLFG